MRERFRRSLFRTNSQAEASRRLAYAIVQAKHLESRYGGTRNQHGREMYGIQRSNWLTRKWLARALDNL
ncbi:MAG: hypothetical protein HYZ57_08470 [Acidobacteria bacterium]|nr:hypothetical protein [Acidobacteriota bacterium]